MHGTFATTLQTLSESPEVAKATGIGEERTLILDAIDALSVDLTNAEIETGDRMSARDVLSRLKSIIRSDEHRKEFDGSVSPPDPPARTLGT